MEQDEVIRRFVAKYNECQPFKYQITRWPDKENRKSRDCDAYAEAPGGRPLAIEHTNIETFHNQKLDSARFDQICGELERQLKFAFDSNVSLTIPTFAIQPGRAAGINWNKIRDTLRGWLLTNVPFLPLGRSDHQIEGVPFRVTICKEEGEGRSFTVARWVPPCHESRVELIESMMGALADKNDQLSKYRQAGAETVVLLETDDIALVNFAILYKAFLLAHESVPTRNVDQVWMTRTYENDSWIYCFLAPECVMERTNPPNFMYGPRYHQYWSRVLNEGEA